MKTITIFTLLIISLNNHSFLGKFLEFTGGGQKELPNCDSEAVKEKKYDKDFSSAYWIEQLNKSIKKNDYCRQAQLWWHLYLVEPKYYTDNNGYEKTIKALYKGEFFLELQWKIKNYTKTRGHKEHIDYIQVSSYWNHLQKQAKKDAKSSGCYATLGYFENPKTGERFTLLEESFLSANDFIRRYPQSNKLQEVKRQKEYIKDINGRKQLCSAKSSLKVMEKRKKGAGPENYWSIYRRLAQILTNYQNSLAIEESLYLMAKIIKKIEASTASRISSPVDKSYDFLYNQNWQSKFYQLANILLDDYPTSPWTEKLRQEFL